MLVGSTLGGTWEDPGGGFFKFAVNRALKQDQIVDMEGKLLVICNISKGCCKIRKTVSVSKLYFPLGTYFIYKNASEFCLKP